MFEIYQNWINDTHFLFNYPDKMTLALEDILYVYLVDLHCIWKALKHQSYHAIPLQFGRLYMRLRIFKNREDFFFGACNFAPSKKEILVVLSFADIYRYDVVINLNSLIQSVGQDLNQDLSISWAILTTGPPWLSSKIFIVTLFLVIISNSKTSTAEYTLRIYLRESHITSC